MSTVDELLKQAKDAEKAYADKIENFENIPNLGSQKLPTKEELKASEYWADEFARTYAEARPGVSANEVAYEKLKHQKDILEEENLAELVTKMNDEKAHPEVRNQRRKDDLNKEQRYLRVKGALEDMKAPKANGGIDFANLVNEISGKRPTEIQLQAADYWADQYVITQRETNPDLTSEEKAKIKDTRKKDLLESGNLSELVTDMVKELKSPDKIAARQSKDVKNELKIQDIAQVFKQNDGK